MSELRDDKLKDALEIKLNKMQALGMLPPLNNPDTILNNVVEKVGKEITAEKLRTPNIKKGLMLCIMAEAADQNQPQAAINIEKFFAKKEDAPESRKEVKDELSKLFNKLYELTPGTKKPTDDELEKEIDRLIEQTSKEQENDSKKDSLIEDERIYNLLLNYYVKTLEAKNAFRDLKEVDSPRKLANRNLNGGKDPENVDSQTFAQSSMTGNSTGVSDQSGQTNATSGTFLDVSNSYRGTADGNGVQNVIRTHLETISDTIDEDLTEKGVYKPSSPRPGMPGTSTRPY